MGEENIRRILGDFGLTEKESEVYIFLSRKGTQKCGEIAIGMKRHKAQIYRLLKILETKGLVESTLESPVRFNPVPFQRILDLTIKARLDEAATMEKSRKELVDYWQSLRIAETEASVEKFTVLEGKRRIYPKISQMIQESCGELAVVFSVSDLLRVETAGILDAALNHSRKSKIQFRFLTNLPSESINIVERVFGSANKTGANFNARIPELGLQLPPRMIIKDNEEMLFFIRNIPSLPTADTCLWTNCKELVRSFSRVFNELWANSTEIHAKIAEIKTGKPVPQTCVISDCQIARTKYGELLDSAKDEIIVMTSAKGLVALSKNILRLKKWAQSGVFVRILAPIVSENFKAAQNLSESCFVKHTPASYLNTTIIDTQHLFQFKNQALDEQSSEETNFGNTVYSSDAEYIEKTRTLLSDVWKNAREMSEVAVVSLREFLAPDPALMPKKDSEYIHLKGFLDYPKRGVISEKEIRARMFNAKKFPAKDPLRDVVRYYGSRGVGIIHPQQEFGIPDLILFAFNWNEYSSFGVENRLMVSIRIDKPDGGHKFLPVATIGDNPLAMEFLRGTQAGTPSAKTQLVKKDEIQVQLQGKTLFVGWTVPIPLNFRGCILPPGCVFFEGHGPSGTSLRKSISPSGRMQISMFTHSEASLTFFHPSSKYSGPGTDACLHEMAISTTYPPILKEKGEIFGGREMQK
jgi:sugar-specific transcriptional regulator TrmB